MYTFSRTSYKIVLLINVNKYLHCDTSETEVNINTGAKNGSEKFFKKKVAFGTLIIAVYASVI
jgi:hypothetical protein